MIDKNIDEKIMLSIIVPIYNAESNLKRCLDSIKKIDYDNFEILLIDDGSTDNSISICEEFVNQDSRFSLHKKQNGGVSSARNYGLKKAQGKYIFFIDSDDYINNYKFKNVIYFLHKDIEVLNFLYLRDENEINVNKPEIKIINRNELLNSLKRADFSNDFGYVWNKIYKKEIIESKNILFEENIFEREDFLFNIDYFENVNEMVVYDDYIYHYIQYENSLSKKGKDSAFICNFINVLDVKLQNNYLKDSIIIEDVVLEMMADYIVKSVFGVYKKYKDIKNEFVKLYEYNNYIHNSNPHNTYLKILKKCFSYRNVYPFYFYYKLSNLKKKVKSLRK